MVGWSRSLLTLYDYMAFVYDNSECGVELLPHRLVYNVEIKALRDVLP